MSWEVVVVFDDGISYRRFSPPTASAAAALAHWWYRKSQRSVQMYVTSPDGSKMRFANGNWEDYPH